MRLAVPRPATVQTPAGPPTACEAVSARETSRRDGGGPKTAAGVRHMHGGGGRRQQGNPPRLAVAGAPAAGCPPRVGEAIMSAIEQPTYHYRVLRVESRGDQIVVSAVPEQFASYDDAVAA